jgi:hypothetical protein
MPYPDRQNSWPYGEPDTRLSWGVTRTALIGLVCVVGVVLACFL